MSARKFNVAISIGVTESSNIWANGLNQNLAFLAQLLRRSPMVDKVWLVQDKAPETMPEGLAFAGLDAPLVRPEQITHDVDVVIEFGTTLPLEWVKHIKALGAKIITYMVGHAYPGQAELAVFDRQGGFAFVGTPWDEIWTLPSFMKTSAPMLRTIARAPVVPMPHIWSPFFLQEPIRRAQEAGRPFGFRPPQDGAPRRSWRMAIFEPNISVVKTCFLPMLICDQAYRLNRASVELMMVLNTFHMKEHPTFNSLATHLDLTRDHKSTFEPRLPFVDCMTEHRIDGVVAHHWESEINYAYYDALYGGYPLIHNSEALRSGGVGIFYPDFKASEGARVLVEAWLQDAGFWQDYRRRADEFLARMAPDHPANIELFSNRLRALLGDRLGS